MVELSVASALYSHYRAPWSAEKPLAGIVPSVKAECGRLIN